MGRKTAAEQLFGKAVGSPRGCCRGGKRHWWWDRRKFTYHSTREPVIAGEKIGNDAEGEGWRFERKPHRNLRHPDRVPKEGPEDREFLCVGGHWYKPRSYSLLQAQRPMVLRSAKDADRLVARLNGCGPVFPSRWIGLTGAAVVVAAVAEVVQVFSGHG